MERQASPKILILESQLIIAMDVSLQLLKMGYDVIGINTQVTDTLKTIESNRPNLILMNIKRQDKEGHINFAKKIMKTFRLPVIFLSAHADRELFDQVINVQPYAFITKPFEAKDLKRGLQTALDRMQLEGFLEVSINDPVL